jgi:transposase-like protein
MPLLGSNFECLTENEQILIVNELSMLFADGKLPRGSIKDVATRYNVNRTTVGRIWKRAREAADDPMSDSPGIFSRKKFCGRSSIYDSDDIASAVKQLPLNDRKTYADLSQNLGIPSTTLHDIIKKTGCLRPHTSSLRPSLTDDNKQARYDFCIDHLDDGGSYKDMKHIIHIDEKWFYMTSVKSKFYLAAGEKKPYRCVRHKSHIDKVMFLAAVAQPRHYYEGGERRYFDGKIGIWPIGAFVPAVRGSRNRPQGTIIWHNHKVDRNKYREMIINNVLPAVKEKFPYQTANQVLIQQDNATSHIALNDEAVAAKIDELGLNVLFSNQPPNSPDLNICDLSFFRALQSMQLKVGTKNNTELIRAVHSSFERYALS